jgi:hypothetical protein
VCNLQINRSLKLIIVNYLLFNVNFSAKSALDTLAAPHGSAGGSAKTVTYRPPSGNVIPETAVDRKQSALARLTTPIVKPATPQTPVKKPRVLKFTGEVLAGKC